KSNKKELSPKQREVLLRALKDRFEKNLNRHKGLEWAKVQAKLEANAEKLWSLNEMESTGGEPDVVSHDKKTGEYVFYDCSAESPKGRTSVCYDREGLESWKEHKPKNNAIDVAAAMGIELLTEEEYQELQKLGNRPAIIFHERPQIRLPPTAEESRLHRRGRAHARARHRGQHGAVQRGQWRSTAATAVSRTRSFGDVVGKHSHARRRSTECFAAELRGLAGA